MSVPDACPIKRSPEDFHGHSQTDGHTFPPGFKQAEAVAETIS
jgi:hypothetical protein